jgi:hypothetical protein
MNKKIINKLFNENSPNREMTKEEMSLFMGILMSKDPIYNKRVGDINFDDDNVSDLTPLMKSTQVRIFLKRLENLTTLDITLGALLVLSLYFENFAIPVIYAYYLKHKVPENTLITTDTISYDLFPFGFFSEKQLNDIWHGQKLMQIK